MTIDTFEIDKEQKNRLLELTEGHFNDVKSYRIKPRKLLKTVSAFANSDGGDIYVGIEEEELEDGSKKRQWNGFSDKEAANGHIQALHETFPFQKNLNISFLKHNSVNGFVLHIQISKTKQIVESSDGTPYVRRGAQSLPVNNHDELKRLEYDKGIITYEQQTLNVPNKLISESEVIQNFISDVIPTTEPKPWLKKQLLIQNGKPTVAGVILFADEPQVALPKQSGIKIFRYKTKDAEGSRATLAFDPITIEGCAYSQIKDAVDKTTEIVEDMQYLGEKGFESIQYPFETLHEIITNAVIHRDYSIKSDIQIVIFDNRIEIKSPGKLPGHVTINNILDEQLARNGTIVRIINKFPDPPNKDVGEGLNTAFEAMRKLRLKEPKIIESKNSVSVKIFHEPLASPEEMVMQYLENHSEISNSIARELCGIDSENEMKRVFQRLQSSDLLERTPGKRGSASTWRKPDSPKTDGLGQTSLFND